ncbi:alpha/beta fold hydrolase [Pacificimonas aurantium]|nr:alpha/beta fold hydrolase [Pacificimonas aurantium]
MKPSPLRAAQLSAARMSHLIFSVTALIASAIAAPGLAQDAQPFDTSQAVEADFVMDEFTFGTGERLEDVRLHYRTLGTPHRGPDGEIDNAVMILHGTGGTGAQFLRPRFTDLLFGEGQPLDTSRYFIILPDNIGHGGSTKPSDGLRMNFPAYDYDDMVEAQRRLLREGLGIEKLRLAFGTSMGCMHIFMWAERDPDFADAAMPMACLPAEIAGRNRMWRMAAMDMIKTDPAWQGGNYETQPVHGIRGATYLGIIAGSAPVYLQKEYPTREEAEAYLEERIEAAVPNIDANDYLYYFNSSRNYNPWPDLEKIEAPMTWMNSADDFINPPGLRMAEAAAARMPTVRYILIPEDETTQGHSTHTWAKFWQDELVDLLQRTE